MKKYAVEFLGTFFLVLTVAMSGNIIAIGAVLAAVIYAGAAISGAHYNPAVSLAVWWQKKLSSQDLGYYVASQLAGGFIAALVSYMMLEQMFLPAPAANASWQTAFIAEALFTFLLAYTVLQVALPKKVAGNQYFGLAIAFTVIAGAICVGSISGASFNPAVGVAPLLLDIQNISGHMPALSLYILGPLLGGFAASLVFSQLNPD